MKARAGWEDGGAPEEGSMQASRGDLPGADLTNELAAANLKEAEDAPLLKYDEVQCGALMRRLNHDRLVLNRIQMAASTNWGPF